MHQWFKSKGWLPFGFQTAAWDAVDQGLDGLVNAPTGSGKSYALLVPAMKHAALHPNRALQIVWLTPIRALAKEIYLAATRLAEGCSLNVTMGIRTGDTSSAERRKQKEKLPNLLITTPESLHLLLCDKDHRNLFKHLKVLVADEWHELIGSKRGVQVELAAAWLRYIAPGMQTWGISATIGNLHQAMEVLVSPQKNAQATVIRSDLRKMLTVETLIPESFERLPWSGHIGTQLVHHVVEVIEQHTSTLVFTNTRAQSEIWYRQLMEHRPDLAGLVAMHHSALDRELRNWVEDALYDGKLKAVVCTSSLDLGVDFRPVEAVVQIGGPKGVARFIQRAGRSGHQPGAASKIWFLPTKALELIEAAALREAIERGFVEERLPLVRSFDVLVQFLVSLATGGGFAPGEVRETVASTHAFASMDDDEWAQCLRFITTGGASLEAYPEYRKVTEIDGRWHIASTAHARRHRMSVGTIVGDTMVRVKYRRGATIGHVEEYFAAGLNEGDVFWFAGRSLETLSFKGTELEVRNTTKRTGKIPAWQGGRLPLSSMLSELMQEKITSYLEGDISDREMERIGPVFDLQQARSVLPGSSEFLVEALESKEGFHLFLYPFAGRLVHEGMASLVAYRIGLEHPRSFSMAFNDYGFELLTDRSFPVTTADIERWLTPEKLITDLQSAVNAAEIARRKFRDIAVIAGLIFRGYPGAPVKDRHLQMSSSLVFEVFADYDAHNLLYRQAFDEMLEYQLEIRRFREALAAIRTRNTVLTCPDKPTPLGFPIMVDRLRERMSMEQLEDRIARMQREI